MYPHLPAGVRMFLEYKLYEPALYSTDVQDWGQSLVGLPRRSASRRRSASTPATTRWASTSSRSWRSCSPEGRLGGFDLNDKKYGDDDLMVGSIDPYQLFRIAHELVNAMRDDGDPVAQRCANEIVYMLDQCHNIEPKIPAMIRIGDEPPGGDRARPCSWTARRCWPPRPRATSWRRTGCWPTRSRPTSGPLLAELRTARGLPADPYRAYLDSGEAEARAAARADGAPAGWG